MLTSSQLEAKRRTWKGIKSVDLTLRPGTEIDTLILIGSALTERPKAMKR